MPKTLSRWIFLAALLLGAVYLLLTVGSLPERVASHFDASGAPNGTMNRDSYRLFILGFTLGLPLLVVSMLGRVYRKSAGRMNIPNRDYWLAPERVEDTIAFLTGHAQWLGTLLVLLFCAMHHLLLQANSVQPPHLPGSGLNLLMLLPILGVGAWIITMLVRLRRKPAQ
jgi:uncharacterized membrane protein